MFQFHGPVNTSVENFKLALTGQPREKLERMQARIEAAIAASTSPVPQETLNTLEAIKQLLAEMA